MIGTLLILAAMSASALADTRPAKGSLQVTSSAFQANGAIPPEYTCDGGGKVPPLAWSNVPKETQTVAILVDDPDAPGGTFVHWLVTDIPPSTHALASGVLPEHSGVSKNGAGKNAYAPPCPPDGTHHYRFHVYALDTSLPLLLTRAQFFQAIEGHVLADGQLIGTYQKQAK